MENERGVGGDETHRSSLQSTEVTDKHNIVTKIYKRFEMFVSSNNSGHNPLKFF